LNISGLCRRSGEVPFTDGEADDLDAALEVVPLTSELTPAVFLVGVKGLVGERSAELIRGLDVELVLPVTDLCLHIGEAIREFFNSVTAVPRAHRLLYRLPTVIGVVRGVGTAHVTVKDSVVDEPFEDALGGFV
jgi:ABC-type glucose/galactose transport system permease subunit